MLVFSIINKMFGLTYLIRSYINSLSELLMVTIATSEFSSLYHLQPLVTSFQKFGFCVGVTYLQIYSYLSFSLKGYSFMFLQKCQSFQQLKANLLPFLKHYTGNG